MRGPTVLSSSMCGLMLAASSPTQAGSVSSTLEVSLTVLPGCSVSAAPLAFVTRAGRAAEAEAAIDVACSEETGVAVSLDAGRHPAGGARRLANPAGTTIPYAIYADAARTSRWQGAPITGQAGPDRPLALTAFGRVGAADTEGAAGEYRDTVTVTVAF